MRLSYVKTLINLWSEQLLPLIPEREPKRPISKLVLEFRDLMRKAIKMHPEHFYADGNFPRLVECVCKALVYICEEDGHYAGQLSQAFLVIWSLVDEGRRRYPEGAEGDYAWMSWAAQHPILRTE